MTNELELNNQTDATFYQRHRVIISYSLLTGVLILLGFLAMLTNAGERDVIPVLTTPAQIMLVLPIIFAAFITARSQPAANKNYPVILIGSVVGGLLMALPTLILVWLNLLVKSPALNGILDTLAVAIREWGILSLDNLDAAVYVSLMIPLIYILVSVIATLVAFLPYRAIYNIILAVYQRYRVIINSGVLSGVVVLFLGIIGMLANFMDREVVREAMTLAQVLLVLPVFIAAFLASRRQLDAGVNLINVVLESIVIGVLTALPTLLMLWLNAQVFPDMRDILVNINRDWIEVVTFDNRDNLFNGGGILLLVHTGFSVLAMIIAAIPQKISRALIWATSITLIIGVFGETVGLILDQLISDDMMDAIFRRDVLKQTPAVVLLVLSLIGSLAWSFGGKTATKSYESMPERSKNTARVFGMAFFLAILFVLPAIIGTALSNTAVFIGIFVLMGLGLNIAIGLAGLLDLGYVTNYAVGAYVMAVLTSIGPLGLSADIAAWLNTWLPFTVADHFINFWMVLPVAILAAMLTGFIFALPVLKMRGDYLAIATLGFGEIIGKLVISDWFSPVIGGAQGVQFVPKPNFFGVELADPEQMYYVVLFACLLTLYVSIRLNNSRTGRQWMAIREDEDVAAAMGINVSQAKLLAFTLSAATGGLAGAIFASNVGSIFPSSFTVFVSINVLSLIIVGGIGSNPGIFLGALVLIGMPEFLRELGDFRFLIYGALLIFMMVNRPEGLWPSAIRQREIRGDSDKSQPAPDAQIATS